MGLKGGEREIDIEDVTHMEHRVEVVLLTLQPTLCLIRQECYQAVSYLAREGANYKVHENRPVVMISRLSGFID